MRKILQVLHHFFLGKRAATGTLEKLMWLIVVAIVVPVIAIGLFTHINNAASQVTTKIDQSIQ